MTGGRCWPSPPRSRGPWPRSRSARTACRCWPSARWARTRAGWCGSTWPAARNRCWPGTRRRMWPTSGCTRTPASRRSSRSSRTGWSTGCWTRPSALTWPRSAPCIPATRRSATTTTRTRRGWWRSTPTLARCPTTATTGGPGPAGSWSTARPSWTRTGGFLFDSRPELARYELAPMEPFSFTARDGLTIHGYATFPPGAGRENLPMVLDVHGGPWARDAWGFDPEAQWLANRGYLCVQVNFRGSTGYGKAFVNAGDREWGGRMQDDLSDAVAYVTGQAPGGQHWADPARVAIYGGSYGGYASLAGAAFTPELFRCAVDIVGPSNLKTLIETIPPYWAPMIAQFHNRVGDPGKDADFLWSRSPLSRAADIAIPLLIAQGANDPRVKQAESEQIVAALENAGIEHEYLLFPDEGHGFAKPENRLRFYAAAERFLAHHLGGRAEE